MCRYTCLSGVHVRCAGVKGTGAPQMSIFCHWLAWDSLGSTGLIVSKPQKHQALPPQGRLLVWATLCVCAQSFTLHCTGMWWTMALRNMPQIFHVRVCGSWGTVCLSGVEKLRHVPRKWHIQDALWFFVFPRSHWSTEELDRAIGLRYDSCIPWISCKHQSIQQLP